jgi:hypothetical protein
MDQKVTIFKNVTSVDTPYFVSIEKILDRIKKGNSKELITSIRAEKDKDARNEIKKNLPAICFSGLFSKRSAKSLEEHSGIICLDFDDFKTKKEMNECKSDLAGDDFVLSVFISPSGDGLKVLVKIPKNADEHKLYFDALADYFSMDEFDMSCSDVSRVCYESYDPKIYINYDSDIWEEKADREELEVVETVETSKPYTQTIEVDDVSEKIKGLEKWWLRKTGGLVSGNRNNNMFVLCAALNEFGIPMHEADAFVTSMAEKGFSTREIRITLNSAYSDTAKFGTKVFEDRSKVSEYASMIRKGETKAEVKKKLIEREGIDPEVVDDIVTTVTEKSKEMVDVFWTKSDKGKITMSPYEFSNFLEGNGYSQYKPFNGDKYVFIQQRSNFLHNVLEVDIKKFVLNDYLRQLDDKSIFNFFASNTKFFKGDFLDLLPETTVETMRDTPTTAHLYYKNCVVIVTKDGVETVDYADFGSLVWADQVIDREYAKAKWKGCDFDIFVNDLADSEKDRKQAIRSAIGYLLHDYKDEKNAKAVILNDEVISDNPEGGTGKGLFVKSIGKMKNTVTIEGKSFNSKERFSYQTVKPDTQIISYDDVKHNFDFESLFSIITEGITLEYKNQGAMKIDFKDSPKIVITTNYAIGGKGNSHDRRRWELEFSQVYTKEEGGMTPYKRLGRRLFGDWDEEEWMRFDNYMIDCLQLFLEKGKIDSEFKNMAQRKFHSETNKYFAEWADDKANRYTNSLDSPHLRQEMFNDFVMMNPDFRNMKRNTFYDWIHIFGKYKYNSKCKEKRLKEGVHYTFVDKTPKPKQSKMNLN